MSSEKEIILYHSTLDDSIYPDLPFVNDLELNISKYVDVVLFTVIRKLIGDKICPAIFVFNHPDLQVRKFCEPQKVVTILRFGYSEDHLAYLNKLVALTPCQLLHTRPLILKRFHHRNNTYEFCCYLKSKAHPSAHFRISGDIFKLVVRFRRK